MPFLSELFRYNIKIPFLRFLRHVIKLLHFQRMNTFFCPRKPVKHCSQPEWTPRGKSIFHSFLPPLVFKPVKAYLPGNQQIMTTFNAQMTPALQSDTAAQMSRQPTRSASGQRKGNANFLPLRGFNLPSSLLTPRSLQRLFFFFLSLLKIKRTG